jgi:hypothetical protein
METGMPLSKDEFNNLVEKLRDRFDDYAKRFSPKWFDRNAFEDRYRMAIVNNMDLDGFILAEIANFEKVREQYEKKKKEKEKFSLKIEKILEDNFARITHYPHIDFHPRAGIEMKYMFGALAELGNSYIPVLWLVFSDYMRRNTITELEHLFQRIALPRGSRPPEEIEDHILLLNRDNVTDLEMEKARNNYLKESAFLLYDVIDFCDKYIGERVSELDLPVRFDKAFFNNDTKQLIIENFSDCTGFGALLKIKTRAELILADFRLTAFRPGR